MSHWYCPPGRKALVPIPAEKLPDHLRQPIHLKGSPTDHRYTLVDITGTTITVSRGRKSFIARAADALYPRNSKT
jgi:hypothetical protein